MLRRFCLVLSAVLIASVLLTARSVLFMTPSHSLSEAFAAPRGESEGVETVTAQSGRECSIEAAPPSPALDPRSKAPVSKATIAAQERLGDLTLADFAGRRLSAVDCGIVGRFVRFRSVRAYIPRAGRTHVIAADHADGIATHLRVSVDPQGLVGVHAEEVDESVVETGNPSNDACTSTAGAFSNRIVNNLTWRPNPNTLKPANLSVAAARAGMKAGFDIILTSRNDCGLPDVMGFTETVGSDSSTDQCEAFQGDEISSVGFSNLASNVYAVECGVLNSNGIRIESDIEYNSVDFNFVNTITSNCQHSVHLPSIAAHETGHMYGLQHVSVTSQTMHGGSTRCSTYKSTLGNGDHRILDERY